MRTLKTLKPGQAGTKALLARYGASLLRVRYPAIRPGDAGAPQDGRAGRPEELPTSLHRPTRGAQGLPPHRLAGDRPPPAGQGGNRTSLS